LFYTGDFRQSEVHFSEALGLDPNNAGLRYDLANALAAQGKNDEAIRQYSIAVSLEPGLAKSPVLHDLLAASYAKAGQFSKAVIYAERALNLARAAGNQQLAEQIRQRIEYYQQQAVSERLERYKLK
jgi:tetratricopeptide (TPR) repeat protein